MKSISHVINALRCTSTPRPKYGCTDCPYRRLEKVEDDIPIKEDVIIDGEKYWEICDVEQVTIDAANMLEKIQQNMETDIKSLKAWEITAEENANTGDSEIRTYYDGEIRGLCAAIALAEYTQKRINADAENGRKEE